MKPFKGKVFPIDEIPTCHKADDSNSIRYSREGLKMQAGPLLVLLVLCGFAWATGPRVLMVQAHPDDETMFAGLLFKTSHDLLGVVWKRPWHQDTDTLTWRM